MYLQAVSTQSTFLEKSRFAPGRNAPNLHWKTPRSHPICTLWMSCAEGDFRFTRMKQSCSRFVQQLKRNMWAYCRCHRAQTSSMCVMVSSIIHTSHLSIATPNICLPYSDLLRKRCTDNLRTFSEKVKDLRSGFQFVALESRDLFPRPAATCLWSPQLPIRRQNVKAIVFSGDILVRVLFYTSVV